MLGTPSNANGQNILACPITMFASWWTRGWWCSDGWHRKSGGRSGQSSLATFSFVRSPKVRSHGGRQPGLHPASLSGCDFPPLPSSVVERLRLFSKVKILCHFYARCGLALRPSLCTAPHAARRFALAAPALSSPLSTESPAKVTCTHEASMCIEKCALSLFCK